jgi:hypothetical protein
MKVIQSKSFFEEKLESDHEIEYNNVIFKYNPENSNVNTMTSLYDNQLLIAKIRATETHGVTSYYFVEDANVDEVFRVLKNLADVNTKEPHLSFELAVLDEFDQTEILSNPNNFLVVVYIADKLTDN